MSARGILGAALLALASGAESLVGQSARGEVRLVIEPVRQLGQLPTPGELRRGATYSELLEAVRVQVSSNVPWRLVVRTKAGATGGGPDGGAGEASPVWVRVAQPGGARAVTPRYVQLAGPVVVAEGEAGAVHELTLDCRWIAEEGIKPEDIVDGLMLELDGP